MKARHIIPALLILSTGVAVQFADARPRDGRPGRLAEALELTEDQRAQLKALGEQHRESMRETMEGIRAQVEAGELTPEQAREQMQPIREAHRAEVERILTPEQIQKLGELRAARQERAGERGEGEQMRRGPRMGHRRGAGHGPGHGPGHPFQALDLSEDQQAQLKALGEQHRESMRETMEGIRAQVEAGELTPEQAREQMQPIREAHRAEVEKILTPEQIQKLEETKANWTADGETAEMEQALTTGPTAPTAVQEESWGEIKRSVNQR